MRMSERRPSPRPVDAIWASAAAWTLVGLGIARLTLTLNPHLAEDRSDAVLLHFWLVLGYGALGIVFGAAGAVIVLAVSRLLGGRTILWWLTAAVTAGLGLAPLAYLLSLPDMRLGSGFLTSTLAAGAVEQALRLSAAAAVLAAVGLAFALGLGSLARRLGTSTRIVLLALWVLGAVGLLAGIGPVRPPDGREELTAGPPEELPPAPAAAPPRVVLLTIDGADLDDVILPMVEGGDLPTFSRLMREGAWGPLETFEPTLSAVVWTTLITGKPPAAHGIRHFLHFRLPGVRQAIYEFPLHTGLNFHLFPLLERIPGLPVMRTPYTSNMRRAEALWNIVGRRYRVGAYRWLISWPAEKLNGFCVAGGLGWIQFTDAARLEIAKTLRGRAAQPPGLGRLLAEPDSVEVPREAVEAYVGRRFEVDRDDPRLEPILGSFKDFASRDLPVLIERFEVRFAAASFYSVDPFHHLFNAYRGRGGIFSEAIAERYRFTDARLGELLEALGDGTRVIVVSDHGYDFEHNHHTYAPEGVFFARGPGFDRGRRVDGLSVYDVAPLVLRLLDMPLPEDMPGTATGAYRAALSREFLDAHPEMRIATYETLAEASHESIASPKDDELRELLKSLGYIE